MLVNIFLSDIEKGRLESIYTWACGEHSEQKGQGTLTKSQWGKALSFNHVIMIITPLFNF